MQDKERYWTDENTLLHINGMIPFLERKREEYHDNPREEAPYFTLLLILSEFKQRIENATNR